MKKPQQVGVGTIPWLQKLEFLGPTTALHRLVNHKSRQPHFKHSTSSLLLHPAARRYPPKREMESSEFWASTTAQVRHCYGESSKSPSAQVRCGRFMVVVVRGCWLW